MTLNADETIVASAYLYLTVREKSNGEIFIFSGEIIIFKGEIIFYYGEIF